MSEQPNDEQREGYEAPEVENVETQDDAAVTAAGGPSVAQPG